MNQDESAFLKDLQDACLKEVEDYLNDFREVLSTFKDDYINNIEKLQKVIHSMKGNLQAVSFLNFGNYVHQLETILENKTKEMTSQDGKVIPDFEILVCEFLISSILEAMVSYHAELTRVGVDSEALAMARTDQLMALDKWSPKFEDSAGLNFTPPEQIKYDQPDVENILHFEEAINAATVPDEKSADEIDMDEPETEISVASVEATAPVLEVVPAAEPVSIPTPEPVVEIQVPDVQTAVEVQPSSPVHLEVVQDITHEAAPVAVVEKPKESRSDNSGEGSKPSSPTDWKNYTGSGLFLLFQNGKKYFAIAIEHIVEVIKSQSLSSPPHRRKNLSGLLNLRGEVLPILKLEEIVANKDARPTYVVVSQVDDMRFGFQVETVHQVVTLDPKQFQAVDGISNSDDSIVTHFCQTEDKTISILKLKELVAA